MSGADGTGLGTGFYEVQCLLGCFVVLVVVVVGGGGVIEFIGINPYMLPPCHFLLYSSNIIVWLTKGISVVT